MKKIAILGSTGSIGTQTLDVVRANGDLEVVGISAGSNITLLEQQIREFHPKFAAVGDEAKAAELRDRVKDLPVKIGSGMDGMIELATMPESEILVTAIVGMIGIRPTVAAMKAGKDIALANKETLVTAGHIIMPLAEECGVQILPVDSEHSAIFQCLHGENRKEIEKLLITASGGPFRGKTRAELENVTVEQALRHPNWSMGHKITIDSATLVNKGLEVMEAKWLFGVDLDHIQVVVQPKSIIHSMVEFKDGAVMAQLGTPDMKLPITFVGRNTMGIYFFHYPIMIVLNGLLLLSIPQMMNVWVLFGVSWILVLILGSKPVSFIYNGVLNLITFIFFKREKKVQDEGLEDEYDEDEHYEFMLKIKKAIDELAATLDDEDARKVKDDVAAVLEDEDDIKTQAKVSTDELYVDEDFDVETDDADAGAPQKFEELQELDEILDIIEPQEEGETLTEKE